MGLRLKSERGYSLSEVQGYADTRMGGKRTWLLALGAGLGVLLTAGLIHVARQGRG